ncbi:MAG: DUF3592 domain-containing protein, partial [Anaerolineae bacterium]|nr:DUF3592 domain-containing protein [Anaerolineae bacterium]
SRTRNSAAGDDREDAFDRQFDRDVRDLEKQSTLFPKLFVAIFMSIAVITLVIAFFSAWSAYQTVSREKSASGVVVDMVEHSSRDSETGSVTTYAYPVVAFAPAGRSTQKIQMSEGAFPPDYGVGDQVTVLYDPERPREARIKSFSSDLLMWLLPAITLLVGLVFGGVAVAVLKIWPWWNKNDTLTAGTKRL